MSREYSTAQWDALKQLGKDRIGVLRPVKAAVPPRALTRQQLRARKDSSRAKRARTQREETSNGE